MPDIRYPTGYPANIGLFGRIAGNLPKTSYSAGYNLPDNGYLSLEISQISGIRPKKYRPNPII